MAGTSTPPPAKGKEKRNASTDRGAGDGRGSKRGRRDTAIVDEPCADEPCAFLDIALLAQRFRATLESSTEINRALFMGRFKTLIKKGVDDDMFFNGMPILFLTGNFHEVVSILKDHMEVFIAPEGTTFQGSPLGMVLSYIKWNLKSRLENKDNGLKGYNIFFALRSFPPGGPEMAVGVNANKDLRVLIFDPDEPAENATKVLTFEDSNVDASKEFLWHLNCAVGIFLRDLFKLGAPPARVQ